MAKLPGSFSTKDVEGRKGDFSAIPADTYRAHIKDSARTPTKETQALPKHEQSKGVHYYKLIYEITEGKYKGRLIYLNLNLEHKKDDVVRMAEEELASICEACGKVSIAATEELHNIEHEIKVGVKAATANYPESNVIRSYAPLSGVKKPVLNKAAAPKAEEEAPKPVPKKKVSFN